MCAVADDSRLRTELRRWQSAGLLTADQAALVFQVQVEQAGGSLASASNRMVLIGAAVGSAVAAGLLAWTGSGLIAFLMAVGVYVGAIAVAAMHAGAYNAWAFWGVFAA